MKRTLLEQAFFKGFKCSTSAYNGEYPDESDKQTWKDIEPAFKCWKTNHDRRERYRKKKEGL